MVNCGHINIGQAVFMSECGSSVQPYKNKPQASRVKWFQTKSANLKALKMELSINYLTKLRLFFKRKIVQEYKYSFSTFPVSCVGLIRLTVFTYNNLDSKTRSTIAQFGSRCFLHMEIENLILSPRFSSNLHIPLGKRRLVTISYYCNVRPG